LEARPFDRSTLGLGAGLAGILDGHKILLGSLEFRPAFESFHLRPWVGMEFGYDLYYAAGGVLTNLHISERNIFTPSFGVGFYSTHNGIELGSHMEFRSAAELSHVFKNHSILGIQFGHISNGGLSSKNPGSEILKLIYYIPW
jgi:hypothetical protein